VTSTAISTILALVEDILPLVTNSGMVAKVVSTLELLLPIIVQEYNDLVQPVKNIIAALSANPAATADQLAALQALDGQADAAFDAAAAAYIEAHPDTAA
jgi:hypothetical protein